MIRRLLATATAATVILTLSACGGGGGEGTDEPRLGPIDELFQDAWGGLNPEDNNAQRMRIAELTAECMAAQGFDYIPVDYSSLGGYSSDDLDVEWGTLEFAELYGYGATTNPWEELMPGPEEQGQWADPNQAYVESMSMADR